MTGSIARRSASTDAEDRMILRVFADGNADAQAVAIHMVGNKERDPNVCYSFALPYRGEGQMISALLSGDTFEYTGGYASSQLAIAATTIAAGLVMTVGLDPPLRIRI